MGSIKRSGIRAVGARAIQIDFRWKSIRYRERIGLEPNKNNLRYAERLLSTIHHEIETGTFNYLRHFPESKRAKKLAPPSSMLLSDLLTDSLKLKEPQVEPETFENYVEDAEYWSKKLKGRPAAEIREEEILSILAEIGRGKKRLGNLLIPLRAAFRLAKQRGVIVASPIAGMSTRRPGKPRPPVPFLTTEVQALAKVDGTGNYWKLWAHTGLRGQELVALKWTDISEDRIHITNAVRRGREKDTKNLSSMRTVPLLLPAKEALAELRKWNGAATHVLMNKYTNEPFTGDQPIRRLFVKACKAAGVKFKHPRLLRHSFASWSLEAGESILWVASVLGHTNVSQVIRTYARHIPDSNKTPGAKLLAALQTGLELGKGV
jgi:integrase